MKRIRALAAVWSLPVAVLAQQGAGNVVYVPTPQVVVDTMLRMAAVRAGDALIDLGSGDGRIVITAAKNFGARAMGVELDRYLLGVATDAARREGVAERARFVEQDLFQTDLAGATVITTYLLPEMNLKLRPKLLALSPGTRVVAHDYHMGDWLPDESVTLQVPEKKVGNPGVSYVYLWFVPAKLAGRWASELDVGAGTVRLQLDLVQRFQQLSGVLRVGGYSGPLLEARLRGDEISFSAGVPAGGAVERYEFRGRVRQQSVEGRASAMMNGVRREQTWTARLVAAGVPQN